MANYHLLLWREWLTGRADWAKELADYYRVTAAEILADFHKKQEQANDLWKKKNRNSIDKIFSFYSETDYFVYRQKWFNRHKAFYDIGLPLFVKKEGNFCEYGSGIGPVTAWLIDKFPGWRYTLVDLNCPAFDFARWRFRKNKNVDFKTVTSKKLPLNCQYDVITCKQVLEHVPNPRELVEHLVDHLKPGGWLYLDYINEPGSENLSVSAKNRRGTLRYLKERLHPVFAVDPEKKEEGYGLYLR